MATQTIARGEWARFFTELSQRRQGSLVELELVGPQWGGQSEARWLPLVEVFLDPKGSGKGSIAVVTGTELTRHLTHTITAPRRVIHKNTMGELMNHEVDDGEVVEITSAGEPPIAILRFKSFGSA